MAQVIKADPRDIREKKRSCIDQVRTFAGHLASLEGQVTGMHPIKVSIATDVNGNVKVRYSYTRTEKFSVNDREV